MTKITKAQLAEIKSNAPVLSIDQLADLMGIARPKFREMLKADPEALAVYKKARARELAGIAHEVLKAARMGCRHRQLFVLERIGGWSGLVDDGAITEETKRKSLGDWYQKLRDIDSKSQ